MSDSSILTDRTDGVFTITLNRPDKLNSFNRDMATRMQAALREAADPDVRAVLIMAAGKGFCAGQDLAEVLPREGEPPVPLGDTVAFTYNPIIRAIRWLEKPVVAAVNGVAAGAGANLAFACDFAVASEKAKFVQSFCKLGLVPDSGGTFFLPRLVGLARATEMAMLGDKIDATRAQELGLIARVYPHDTFTDEARKLAVYLATQPTRGLALIKHAFNRSWGHDLDAQLELERDYQTRAGRSADYAEGVAAFLEKRPPRYTGR